MDPQATPPRNGEEPRRGGGLLPPVHTMPLVADPVPLADHQLQFILKTAHGLRHQL